MLRRSGFINPNGEEYHAFYYYDIHGNLVKVQDEKQGDKTEYDYNSHGTVIKETVGNKRSNDKLIYESQTDTSGDYTVKEYDARYSDEACNTIYTQSAYNSYKGRLSKVTLPNGQAYHYGYNDGGMLDSVSAGFATRNGNNLNHIQNENIQYEYRVGLLTKINRTKAVYEFEYDGYSRVKKVTLNGVTVYTAAYHKTSDGKSYTGASYGNGWNGEEITDEQGRFVEKSVTKDGFKQAVASAEYDENTTLLKSLTDSACGSGKTTQTAYVYNEHGEVTSVQYTGYRNGAYTQETDSEGYVTKTTYEKNVGETQEYRYLYEKHGGTEGNRVPNAALSKTYFYEYDDFGNIEKVAAYSYTTGNSLTGGAERTYSYDSSKRLISVTGSDATQLVGGYDAGKNLVAQYQYDAWGNHKIYGIKNGESIDITNDISYNNSIAKLNRFRYRGYYYDTETGLFYLFLYLGDYMIEDIANNLN